MTAWDAYCDKVRESEPGRERVARWLGQKFFLATYLPPLVLDGNPDHGDVWIGYTQELARRRQFVVEVKWITAQFTCAYDWPFGPHFIVDSKGTFDHKHPPPYAYVVCDQGLRYCGVVRNHLFDRLYVEDRADPERPGEKKPYYLINTRFVEFHDMEES